MAYLLVLSLALLKQASYHSLQIDDFISLRNNVFNGN